jgi:hypothetical protein
MKIYFSIVNGKIQNPAMVRKAFRLPDGLYELEVPK